MSNGRRSIITARIILFVGGLLAGGAGAADKGWNNGANNLSWDTASANWNGATWSEGDNAFFTNANALAKGLITLDGTRSVRDLTVSQNGYSFTGGALQNAGTDTNNFWSIANGVTVTNASPLNLSFTAAGGMMRRASGSGAGRWVQTGRVLANGFDGTTGNGFEVHGGGWLELAGDSAWTNVVLTPLYQGGAATVSISAGTHSFAGGER
ncbi:hypothetical protein HQ563_10920 [bacterium]|nr:hypothetical protein [bacterium]